MDLEVDLQVQDAWSETTSMPDSEGILQSGEQGNSVLRCLLCGDSFPLMDFYYTQKTGLCIVCWERNVI